MRLIGSVVGHESGSSSIAMESRAQKRAAQRSAILFGGIVATLIPASDKSRACAADVLRAFSPRLAVEGLRDFLRET
jgi:hypothetical protein